MSDEKNNITVNKEEKNDLESYVDLTKRLKEEKISATEFELLVQELIKNTKTALKSAIIMALKTWKWIKGDIAGDIPQN